MKRGGVRFTINGHDYFNLVLVTNVAAAGSIKSMEVKTSNSSNWTPLARNWGANWHSLAYLTGQMLSFRVTDTDGQTIEFTKVVPQGWKFGQTFASKLQFKWDWELRAGFPVTRSWPAGVEFQDGLKMVLLSEYDLKTVKMHSWSCTLCALLPLYIDTDYILSSYGLYILLFGIVYILF